MKVNHYPAITAILNRVTDKNGDKQGGAGSNAFDQQQKKKEEEKEFKVTEEAVNEAIDAFAVDQYNLSQGITASSEGNGPGLKVVLKDGAGGVWRSVSGEEFLKLREAVVSGKRSGRILDQKA